MKHMN